LLSAGAGLAQVPPPPAGPAAKAEERPPEAIAIPEIAIRSEQVTSFLRTIEVGHEKDSSVDAIAQELPEIAASNLALLAETNNLLEQGPRKHVLEALADSWRSARASMEARNATLTARASALETDIQKLTGAREIWRRTAEEVSAIQAPATVRDRVQATIAAIDSTQRLVERRRTVLLELQAKGFASSP
jgi:hypothetical protein